MSQHPRTNPVALCGVLLALGVMLSGGAPVRAGQDEWSSAGLHEYFVFTLTGEPANPNVLYVGTYGGGILKSTDGGDHWQMVNSGLTWVQVVSLAVDPLRPNIVYAGTNNPDHGLFKSLNGGGTWAPAKTGLAIPFIYAITIDPVNSDIVYAGTDDGPYKTTDGGMNWSRIATGHPGGRTQALVLDPSDPDILYCSTVNGGILRSTDAGASWWPANGGLPFVSGELWRLAVDPTESRYLYAIVEGYFYYSVDGGESWTQSDAWPDMAVPGNLILDKGDPSIVYVGTTDAGTFLSLDGAGTWSPFGENLGILAVNALYITAANPPTIYAGTGFDFFLGGGVFRRTITCRPPWIVTPPKSKIGGAGTPVTLNVEATGTGTLSYQWYEGQSGNTSLPVEGATQSELVRTVDYDFPPHQYWVRVTDDCGSTDSPAAAVVENDLPFVLYAAHVASTVDWWTRLSVVNAGVDPTPLVIRAYSASGQLVEEVTTPLLDLYEGYVMDVDRIFRPETLAQDLWLRIEAGSDVRGSLEFGTRDGQALATIPLFSTRSGNLLFPYVAMTADWYTGITLINTGTSDVDVLLEGFTELGAPVSTTNVTIPPGNKYVRLASFVFPTGDPAQIRFIRVTSNGSLVGFELFGTFLGGGLAGLPASAPLVGRKTGTEAATYQVIYDEIPDSASYYTGVTVSNLGSQAATVHATLYNAQGAVIQEADWPTPVQPLEQVTREIWAFFGGNPVPGAAYMTLSAPQPLMGFELFLTYPGTPVPFRFDGVMGVSEGGLDLYFPLVKTSPGWSTQLRLTSLQNAANFRIYAYSTLGDSLRYDGHVAAHGQVVYDLATLFPDRVGDIVWLYIASGAAVLGDVVYISGDGTRMGSYMGLPGE